MDIKFAELENKLDDLGKKIDSKFAAFACKLDDLIKKKTDSTLENYIKDEIRILSNKF